MFNRFKISDLLPILVILGQGAEISICLIGKTLNWTAIVNLFSMRNDYEKKHK